MKIALINDTHFGARNDSQAFMNYFRKFYEIIFFGNRKLIIFLFVGVLLLTIANPAHFLEFLSFIDPRITLYLTWEGAAYGQPVENYYFLLIHLSFFLPLFILKDDQLYHVAR